MRESTTINDGLNLTSLKENHGSAFQELVITKLIS